MSQQIKRIVIVGGGSAGWLTAGILAAEHAGGGPDAMEIVLLESPNISPIGVGEGTWPSMRDSLRRMGISETEFIRECDASFKQASRFVHWRSGEQEDFYYHPFAMPNGYGEIDLQSQWRRLAGNRSFADVVSYQPALCEQGSAPKQKTTPEWAAVANYAYHLDAGKFATFLQKFCTTRLGVRHILDDVTAVRSSDNGDIASLETKLHGLVSGDLFIDCTGFSSLLLGKHFGIPFISRKDILFCDTALALQVPYPDEHSPIASNTISTAQRAGWIWDIGLPTRRGVGHVFSSTHCTDEHAEIALRNYLQQSGVDAGIANSSNARKISFNPGHRELFWYRNCVAVGLSAGFIEPLEASALALIEFSAAMIRDELPTTRELMDVVSRRFNERFLYRWDRIMEFLKLHYVLSNRSDSEFWQDNREATSIPPRLQDLLSLWQHRPPSRGDFYQIEEIFPAASYQYVLYGMGFTPAASSSHRPDEAILAQRYFQENRELSRKYLAGLPSNRELIKHVREYGMQKI